jgi:hypothetical protein
MAAMADSIDAVSEAARAVLRTLSREDQSLFLREKDEYLARRVGDSPLLDQRCCLRVVMTRLREGYTAALARFEAELEAKSEMRGGWRDSVTRKLPGEFESPMPWLHPFKLAREDLEPLEEELEAALAMGKTELRGFGRLREVLERHELQLPLPSPHVGPKFLPGEVRVFK